MSEDSQPGASPDAPVGPDVGQAVDQASATRLSDMVVGHLSDQARLTAQAAKARRLASTDGQPGVADLTPLRELLSELVEEVRKINPRGRIGRALRQAADVIDPPDS
jgi:hypothetical protein